MQQTKENDLNYKYNFEYSYAQYSPIIDSCNYSECQSTSMNTNEASPIMDYSQFIIQKKCFIQKSIADKIHSIINHLTSFRKIGQNLLIIIETNLNKNQKVKGPKIYSNLESERQCLMKNIQDFSQQTATQKDKYLKLIALLCSLIILKIIRQRSTNKNVQLQAVFHPIYWEILGHHSTKYILEQLIKSYINQQKLSQFFSQSPKIVNQQKKLLLNSVKQQNWEIKTFGSIRQSQNMNFSKRLNENNMFKSNCNFQDLLQDQLDRIYKMNKKKEATIFNNELYGCLKQQQLSQNLRFGNILAKRQRKL